MASEALADLDAAGVDLTGVSRSATAPTGVALITVDRRGENMIAVAPAPMRNWRRPRSRRRCAASPRVAWSWSTSRYPTRHCLRRRLGGPDRECSSWSTRPGAAMPDGLEAMRPLLTPNRDERPF